MLELIQKFIDGFTEAEEPTEYIHSRKQLAEAALMYHVIQVDGIVKQEERARMVEVLSSHFEMDEEQTASLAKAAEVEEIEAIDLYKFTSLLKQRLDEEERLTMIENLWEMVYADGHLHELEDNVLWRISELIGVDTRARTLLKKLVETRQAS